MEKNLLLKSLNATFNFLKTMLLSFGQIATSPIGSNERKDTILSISIKTGTIENRFVFARQFKSSMTNYFSMALVLLSLFFVNTSTAQGTLGRWQMCGLSGSTGSVNPTGVDANTTFSTLTRGGGLSSSSVSDGYRSSGFSTSNLNTSNNDYYEFTITPDAGYKISLSALKIRDQRSTNNSSFDAYLRSSDDGYASNVVPSWLPSTTLTNRTLDLSGVAALQDRTTAITFRIYGSDSNNISDTYGFFCQGTNSGNFRGIDVDGTAVALPVSIGRWQMCGLSGSTGSVNPTGVDANITLSTLTRGPGLLSSSVSDGYRSSGFSTSNLSTSNNDYYEFTITPDAGYKISLSALKIRDQRSTNSSTFDANLRFSDDGYASNVVASWLPSTTLTNRTLDLSGVAALQDRTTAITFRIYGSDSNNTFDTYGFFCQGTNPSDFKGIDFEGNVIALGSSTISVTGSTSFNYNGSNQGPTTSSVTGSTGAVTYSYSGTGATSYSASATRPTNAGTYQVIATLAADSNYNGAVSSPFAFTINKASLTITANNVNKTYGATLTGGSGSTAFTPSGLQNGQTIGTVTIAYGTGAAATAAVATYTGSVTPSAATGGTFTANNYDITYATGNIIVGKANLTITANDVNKTYGATLTNGAGSTAFTSSGLQNSETIGSVTIAYGSGAASNAAVGTYSNTVTPSAATGGTFNTNNYNISYAAGDITVNPGAFAKLQILLPGETAAPGTGSGKTGTPTGQTTTGAFTVTVNAVDAFWNVVSSAPGNTIAITTTDGAAILPVNAALVSGTRTFSITLRTLGSSTITASNVSNGLITANTSASVAVTAGTKTSTKDGSWSDSTVWSPAGEPYQYDLVNIGTNHDITVPADGACASINFTGTASSINVSTGKTLSVTGAVTLNNDSNSSVACTITGSGTLNANSVLVGPPVTPDAFTFTNTTKLTSSISNFNITNNLAINSYGLILSINNATFELQSGIVSVNGVITTSNGISSNASTFSMASSGSQNRLLILTNASPFSLSGTGSSPMTFTGTNAVVEYLGSVPQTALGTTYKTLKINNSTTGVTLGGNATATTLDLTDGLLTTGSNVMTIASGGTILNASSTTYVNGKLARVLTNTNDFTYPVGKGGVYSPVVFTYAATPGTKTVTIEQFETGSPFSSPSISTTTFGTRYWNITQSATGTSYRVGLNDGGNTPIGSVVMLRKDNASITYNNPTNYSAPNYTNSNAFSATVVSNDVALGETAIPLYITGVTGINTKMYDGNTIATAIGTPMLAGTILSGETITLSGTPVYTFNSKNVGTGKAVTVSGLVLTGATAGAYSLPTNQIPGLSGDITIRPLEITANAHTKVFDNTTSVATLPSITSGAIQGTDTFGFISTFDTKNAGSNKIITPSGIVNDGNGGNNYAVTFVNATGEITPRALTITGATTINKVYDGTDIAATTSGTWTLTGVISPNMVTLNKSAVFASKDAGTWAITSTSTLSGADASNYTLTQPSLTPRSITKIALTISGTVTTDKEYDRTNTAILTGGVLNGVISGEDVSLVLSGRYSSSNAGGPYVITSTSTIVGNDIANYTLTQPTLTPRSISKVSLTVIGASTADKVYNGNTIATVTGGSLVGVVPGDVVSLTQSGIFPDKNVGGPYVITPNFSIGGAPSVNYNLIQPLLADASITPKTLTISGTSQNKVYDGTTIATLNGGGLVGVVSGESVLLDLIVNYYSPLSGDPIKDAGGPYNVISTSTIASGNIATTDINNYTLLQPTLSQRNITKIPLTITGATTVDKEYDRTRNATISDGILNGVLSGEDVTVNLSGLFASANAGGPYTITSTSTLTGLDAANYTLTQPILTPRSISKITLTITGANSTDKVYDGTTNVNVIGGSLVGVVSGDIITLTQSGIYPTKNVGGPYDIIPNFSISGTASTNYILTQADLGQVSITPRVLSIIGTTQNKVYDGTDTATLVGGGLSGVVSGEDVVLDLILNYSSKDAGGPYIITSTSIISGADYGNNYTFTQPNLSPRSIIKAPLTITGITAENKIYDGTRIATLVMNNPTLSGSIVSGETVTLNTLNATGTFDTKNVGTAKTVSTSNFTIEGPYSANYSLIQPTTTADITARTLTITANNISKCAGSSYIFSGTEFTRDYIVPGDVTSVTLSSAGSGISATSGTYSITASNAVGTGIENYDIIYVDGTFVVNTLPIATISVNNSAACLNDTPPIITFTGANGTGVVRYKFYYKINDGTELSVISDTGNSTATVSVPTGTLRTDVYTLVRVEDVNTGCDQNVTVSNTQSVIIGICTSLMNTYRGITLDNLYSEIYAISVSGATGYRFEVTPVLPVAGSPIVVNSTTRSFNLSQLGLGVAAFSTTYSIRVAVNNGGYAYGLAYTISTPAKGTKMMNCGTTLDNLYAPISAFNAPYATMYRFYVRKVDVGTTTIETPSRTFSLSQLTSAGAAGVATYGTNYKIAVEVYIDNAWVGLTSECDFFTPAAVTKLMNCGSNLAKLNTPIFAFDAPLAVEYRFEVTEGVQGANTNLRTFDSPTRSFNLTQISPIGVGGVTYNVRVAIKLSTGGQFQGYSSYCKFTTPAARMASQDINTNVFEVKAFPNPFARHFSLDIQSSSDDLVQVQVYDMLGRTLEVQNATVSELSTKEIGTNYPSGVYNVIVSQGDKVRSVRMIKR